MLHQIQVENIKCGGCMNSIKSALLQTEYVQNVNINKESETILIQTSSFADRNIFVELLSKLGYPEKGRNTFVHKAKSYVSCAIGQVSKSK